MRLESALEIIGALKRGFGEPMTVTDICRAGPLSYQPVYDHVQRLAAEGALVLRKTGQRLLCEPAATPAGALWLALFSLRELAAMESAALQAVAARLPDCPPGAVAVAEVVGRELRLYVTDPVGVMPGQGAPAEVVPLEGLPALLRGPQADWAFTRRAVPLAGQQLFWSLALRTRETSSSLRPPAPAAGARRLSVFD